MIEALVTVVIVAIGVSGVGVLLLRSVQATQDNSQKSQAMWIVQDYIGRIRANSPGAKSEAYAGTFTKEVCESQPATICSAIPGTDAEVCDSTQMATFDTWITICGMDDDSFDTPADFIVNPVLTSSCESGTPGNCVQYLVNLQWNTKLITESDISGERVNTNNYSMVMEVN